MQEGSTSPVTGTSLAAKTPKERRRAPDTQFSLKVQAAAKGNRNSRAHLQGDHIHWQQESCKMNKNEDREARLEYSA